jgi:hypothetical protein
MKNRKIDFDEMQKLDKTMAQKMAEEIAYLKKAQLRRDVVESANLDWDQEYFMSFSDDAFKWLLQTFIRVRNQVNK